MVIGRVLLVVVNSRVADGGFKFKGPNSAANLRVFIVGLNSKVLLVAVNSRVLMLVVNLKRIDGHREFKTLLVVVTSRDLMMAVNS